MTVLASISKDMKPCWSFLEDGTGCRKSENPIYRMPFSSFSVDIPLKYCFRLCTRDPVWAECSRPISNLSSNARLPSINTPFFVYDLCHGQNPAILFCDRFYESFQ